MEGITLRERINYFIPTDPVERKCVFYIRLGLALMISSLLLFFLGHTYIENYSREITIVFTVVFIPSFIIGIVGAVMLEWYRLKGKIIVDERMKKIRNKSSYYAFSVGIVIFIVSIILKNSRILSISTEQIALLFFFVVTGSLPLFYWYFNKKGDFS